MIISTTKWQGGLYNIYILPHTVIYKPPCHLVVLIITDEDLWIEVETFDLNFFSKVVSIFIKHVLH